MDIITTNQQKIILKNRLQVGDVILVHNRFRLLHPLTWLSALIRFFCKNPYNHCGIITLNDFGNLAVNQSLASGVNHSSFQSCFKGEKIKILRYKHIKELYKKFDYQIHKRFNSKIGTPYDYFGCLLHQMVKQSFEMLDLPVKVWIGLHGEKAAKRFYCSEYVAWCLCNPDWWQVSPDDIDKDTDMEIVWKGKIIV